LSQPIPEFPGIQIMIEQQGRVIRLNGNMAEILIGVSSGCSVCDQGKGCGAGIFAQLLRRKAEHVSVRNVIDARPGQYVTLGIPESTYLNILLRLYLLPLISALAGAAIGHNLAVGWQLTSALIDVTVLFTAAAFFAFALLLCRLNKRNLPRHLNIVMSRTAELPPGHAVSLSKSEL
jgi:positive regulator of sigma E activity